MALTSLTQIGQTLLVMNGSGLYYPTYAFVVSAANATPGSASFAINDTYTNNGVTFTVVKTTNSQGVAYLSGASAPTGTGTLVRVSGTGDASMVYAGYKQPRSFKVRMIGGGGSGWPSSTGTASSGGGSGGYGEKLFASPLLASYAFNVGVGGSGAGGGTDSTFGGILSAGGGAPGTSGYIGGNGGGVGGPFDWAINGGFGGSQQGVPSSQFLSGFGGNGFFGGGGYSGGTGIGTGGGGTAPGGGGGGSANGGGSAPGAGGMILIEENF